jgi:hypothetical protein
MHAQVYLEPWAGWRPPWERGLIAAVVLGNALVAMLVGMITASWAQQRRLLGTVMVRCRPASWGGWSAHGTGFRTSSGGRAQLTLHQTPTLTPPHPTPYPHLTPPHSSPPHPHPAPHPNIKPPQDRNVRLADTTSKLQNEKLRLDALLVRQYNLLAVLGGPKAGRGRGGGKDGSTDGSLESKEGLTLGALMFRVDVSGGGGKGVGGCLKP